MEISKFEIFFSLEAAHLPGWKTIDKAGSPNDTFSHEHDAFVGFGNCIYKQVTEAEYDAAKTEDEVALVLATALRTYCVNRDIKSLDNLFNDGLLKMNPDKTFEIEADNEYM